MLNYLKQGWLVLLLALGFGGGLAAVQIKLGPVIAENQRNEIYGRISELVPGGAKEKTREIDLAGETVYKVFSEDGRHVGWVIRADGMGYADKIDVLIGLGVEAKTINGIYVLDQKETPGLGSKIASPKWNRQFKGKPTAPPLEVVKTPASKPYQIDAISGATISSKSLTGIVNDSVEEFRKALEGEARKQLLPEKPEEIFDVRERP
jgi:electron transport complex protein RnfG